MTIAAIPLPTVSIADTSVTEGDSGTTAATFTVSLSAASASPVTVNYTTANGTATAGTDYTASSGVVTFPAGTTVQTITVPVIGETAIESDETFTVTLDTPTNATLSRSVATGTILNDDLPSLSIADSSVTEGNSGTATMTFTVTMSTSSPQTVTVNYATANGTATAPGDYTAASGTLTFPSGTTSQTFTVPVVGDTTVEADETFTVTLSNPSNATFTRSQATGTIHERRRADAVDQQRERHRRQLRLDQRHLHGHAVAGESADRHGRLQHGAWNGDGRRRLHHDVRHADLLAWPDVEDHLGPGARRHAATRTTRRSASTSRRL